MDHSSYHRAEPAQACVFGPTPGSLRTPSSLLDTCSCHFGVRYHQFTNGLFRITVHQRTLNRDIIDRSGRLPEHAPLLPPCPGQCPSPCALSFKDLCNLCFRLNKYQQLYTNEKDETLNNGLLWQSFSLRTESCMAVRIASSLLDFGAT
jgi:hypothetical protein